ncbi:MAG: hypothetical protein KatS3mg110_1989 [Pirellulaceae bacterium]|nr:MAG: hypothetical protein KatS3mg110_1989 [Pirellulaceae bacterium]
MLIQWDNISVPPAMHPRQEAGAVSINLSSDTLRHVVRRHIRHGDGPWDEWLGAPAIEAILEWYKTKGTELAVEAHKTLSERLGAELARALGWPLCQRQSSREDLHGSRWQVVLPNGLLVVLEFRRSAYWFVTMYWPLNHETQIFPEPWRQVAVRLVLNAREWRDLVGQNRFYHEEFVKKYVTPENWGFQRCGEQPSLWQWTGTFPDLD